MSIWRTLALLALSTSVACSGGKDDTDPVDTTTDTPEPEETAPTGSDIFDIEAISIGMEFAYDAATDSLVESGFDGNTFSPTLTFSLGTEDFFSSGDDDEGCAVFNTIDALPARAAWGTAENGLLFGFEFSGNWSTDASACEGILDMVEVEAITAELLNGVWGAGVQSTQGADAQQALAQATFDALGGGIVGVWNDGNTDATDFGDGRLYDPKGGYVQGLGVDENFQLVVNGQNFEQMTEEDMVVDGALQTGYYVLGMVYYWTFQ